LTPSWHGDSHAIAQDHRTHLAGRRNPALGRRTCDIWSGFWPNAPAGPGVVLSRSSTLTSTLLEHGLADDVLLVVYPALLGRGKRFFAEAPPRSFELMGTTAMPSGIIFSTYKVAGLLKSG
jgi:dihydrofolate reductase